ncbi:ABC transporter ATP-binding protein [Clostridium felsineum]|uniref:ABC transporter ATP-binding protein n=1 Tax=Clostridium felsineum TaxID=36839 RepID=UPI00214D319D|nr:ABC transporter ATP-binding protein [Clostridium felsineum]MCR3760477.1 ABC transporter ATP-binding protein [Clostridium felsineum]
MKLELKTLSCGYKENLIVNQISLKIISGEIVCLLGPNGVGKTTLFKTILGFLKSKNGEILLDGEDITKFSREKLAKLIAYVPQAHTPPFPFKVIDVVIMGRTAHLKTFEAPKKIDYEIAEKALEDLNIEYLKDKSYTNISGGERQLVLIARALTQEPKLLVMDEPTSNLDFGNQIRVLAQIKRLSEKGLGVLMTSHSPDHVFLCSSKVVLLQRDNKFTVGTIDEVMTEENLSSCYGVKIKIISTNVNGAVVKSCIPMLNTDEGKGVFK